MLEESDPKERKYYRKVLLDKLAQVYSKFQTPVLFLDERSRDIVARLLPDSQLYGTGLTQIITSESMPDKDKPKVVVVTVLDDQGRNQIERHLHLFQEIFIVNLSLSSKEITQGIKVSPIRKKMKGFVEISLNFLPFIEGVYFANNVPLRKNPVPFEEALTSYLTSLPKFHQYQLIAPLDSKSSASLLPSLEQSLMEKLSILQRHESSQYKVSSSPRLKVLVLERSMDKMSPLLYSYHFGAVSRELGILHNNCDWTIRSQLYSALFPMDIQESCDFLTKIASKKAKNQKQNFNLSDFDTAKKAITNHYDPKSSPEELQLHIDAMKNIREYCQKRVHTASLQQSIVNGVSEEGQQLSSGKVVSLFQKWSKMPQEYNFCQQDYLKLLILAYMVNSFWFWQRRVLNACLEEPLKSKATAFLKQIQGQFSALPQKQQGEERYELFRHESLLTREAKRWISSEDPSRYRVLQINKSVVKRQNRLIIAIKGAVGYNQLCQLKREVLSKTNMDVTVFCGHLVTTKQYLEQIMASAK